MYTFWKLNFLKIPLPWTQEEGKDDERKEFGRLQFLLSARVRGHGQGRAQGSLEDTEVLPLLPPGVRQEPQLPGILNVQSGQTASSKPKVGGEGKHKPKDMGQIHLGWDLGAGGRWCRQGRSIQQMVYITMTGSLESLPSSTAAPAQRGQIRGEEESWTLTGMQGWRQQAGSAQISPRRFL